MMDPKRWINTLPSTIKSESGKENYNLNSEKWAETIPTPKKNNHTKKYSFTIILFVIGLVFVSMIKKSQIKSCHAAADHESGLLVREWGDGDPRCGCSTAAGVQRQGDHRRRASADQ